MEPDARGAGPAVEEEQDRPFRGIGQNPIVSPFLEPEVGDVKDLGLHRTVRLLEDRKRSGDGPVTDLPVVQGHRMFGDDRRRVAQCGPGGRTCRLLHRIIRSVERKCTDSDGEEGGQERRTKGVSLDHGSMLTAASRAEGPDTGTHTSLCAT